MVGPRACTHQPSERLVKFFGRCITWLLLQEINQYIPPPVPPRLNVYREFFRVLVKSYWFRNLISNDLCRFLEPDIWLQKYTMYIMYIHGTIALHYVYIHTYQYVCLKELYTSISTLAQKLVFTLLNNEFISKILNSTPFGRKIRKHFRPKNHKSRFSA